MAGARYANSEAVSLNFGPLMQVAMQEAQYKRAENAYLDRQVATDLAKLKTDGIRPQDVPVFLKQYQNVKDLSIRNRDAIRNPARNPKAYQDYQDAVAQLQGTIAESKGAKEQNKMAYGFYSKNAGKIDQDQFRAAAADFNAPIGTPEFERGKNYDITQAIFKPSQFDQAKFQTFLNAAVKPVDRINSVELPTGQHRNTKVRYTDPNAIQNVVGQAYDNDLQHAKKFYDDQFAKVDPNQIAELETYANKYVPDFKINNGRDYAIAANMYGQVEKDMGETIGGSAWKSQQAFQRDQQNRSFNQQNKLFDKRIAATSANKNYAVVSDVDQMLKAGRYEEALTPFEAATPGAQTVVLKEGRTPATSLADVRRSVKANGIDAATRTLTDEDYKNGVIVTMVPRTNPALPKEVLKVKNKKTGKMDIVYDYMATPVNKKNIQPRLQAHMNYSANLKKPVKDAVFKGIFSPTPPTTPDFFNPSEDDDENLDNPEEEN